MAIQDRQPKYVAQLSHSFSFAVSIVGLAKVSQNDLLLFHKKKSYRQTIKNAKE